MRKPLPLPRQHSQRGVAVITALLLTTLAVTIVASLFWQQQVQVRTMENQRLQLQTQWILRGGLDWARLILREDARHSAVDYLGEAWATPLAETRLDEYVEKDNTDAGDATLSGQIIDAQSRLNLSNLLIEEEVNPTYVDLFERLLNHLKLKPELAQATANLMAERRKKVNADAANGGQNAGSVSAGETLVLAQAEDLLEVPGFSLDILAKLKDYVVVLPPTAVPQINVNTAPAEILAALDDSLTLADGETLVASREKAYFRSIGGDFLSRLSQEKKWGSQAVTVQTNYFLVNSKVHLGRAVLETQALIQRSSSAPYTTQIVWIRDK
ncbi:MAG: type II secretion system minor pseudopilin GspK [Pseudomonadota bacterium]